MNTMNNTTTIASKSLSAIEILTLANDNNRFLSAKFLKDNNIAEGNMSLSKASRLLKSLTYLVNTYITAVDLTTDEQAIDTLYTAIGERLEALYKAWDVSGSVVPARDIILRAVTMKRNDDGIRVLSSKVGASFSKAIQLAVVNHSVKIASAETIVAEGLSKAKDAENGTKKNVTTRKVTKAELMEIVKRQQEQLDALIAEKERMVAISAQTAAAC